MRKHVGSIAWLLGLVVMVACTPSVKVSEDTRSVEGPPFELSAIDSLMWRQPDSALAQLQAFCNSPEADSLGVFNGHYCQVLISELLYKNDCEQTNRTELLHAVSYFDSLVREAPPLQRGAGGIKKHTFQPNLQPHILGFPRPLHHRRRLLRARQRSTALACISRSNDIYQHRVDYGQVVAVYLLAASLCSGLKGLPQRDFGILTTRKQVNQV